MAIRESAVGERLAPRTGYSSRHLSSLPMAVLVATAAALSGCAIAASSARHSENVHTAITTSTSALIVDVGAGSLHLVPGPSGSISLRGTVTYRGDRSPDISWQRGTGGVFLRSVCQSRDGDCGYNYVISVPVSTTIVAVVDAGDIWAKGLVGRMQLNAPAGNVTLSGLSGPLHVTGGSGNIAAAGLQSAGSDFSEGAGNVTLEFAAAPRHLVANAATGNVGVTVPTSFSYHVVTHDQMGNVFSSVSDHASSSRVISLSVGTGNIFLNQPQG